jgi:hypothetical protein
VPLRRLFSEGPSDELWNDLWDELHHQGDVGPASFAAVPYLLEYARRGPTLDWNVFGLIAVIELERVPYCRNRRMPQELTEAYFTAIAQLPEVVATHPQKEWGPELTQHIVTCIALARGQRMLARAYLEMDKEAAITWLQNEIGYDKREVQKWSRE